MMKDILVIIGIFLVTTITVVFSYLVGVGYTENECEKRLYEVDVYYGNELYALSLELNDCKEKKNDKGREYCEQQREVSQDQREATGRGKEEERRSSLHPQE